MTDQSTTENADPGGTGAADCSALLTAYAETCRHIEELERIQSGSKHSVFTCEAKNRAEMLVERILALMPNSPLDVTEQPVGRNRAKNGPLAT